jgi:hypothetical protein
MSREDFVMPQRHCSIEYRSPGEADPAAAPQHPDPEVRARVIGEFRENRPRRFALVRVDEDGQRREGHLTGFEMPDGSAILVGNRGPVGWYTSVDTAYAHSTQVMPGFYLVWLDPPTWPAERLARAESGSGETSIWALLLPFRAHGLHSARLHAIEIALSLEDPVPGFRREAALMFSDKDSAVPIMLFCPEDGCLRAPYHDGEHDPAADMGTDEAATEAEHADEPEPLKPKDGKRSARAASASVES